jgi:hypothetical protein
MKVGVGRNKLIRGRVQVQGGKHAVLIVHRIRGDADGDLPQVAQALRAFGFFLRLAQGRKEHRRKDRDDGNHDKQFNESERARQKNGAPRTKLKRAVCFQYLFGLWHRTGSVPMQFHI